jgi:N-acetylneuraminate synthase/N,N'-diacetyllegionaminate synthase
MGTQPSDFSIGGRFIGAGHPPYIIAEAGVNHNGSPDLALRLVDAAADAGADAIKFQTFKADSLVVPGASQATYQSERAKAGSQLEMLRALELPERAHEGCFIRAAERSLTLISTPFDLASAGMLRARGVPAFKVGSGDLTNLVLLRGVAAYGLPIIVSTGMATMDEVEAAVRDIRAHGDPPLALLHCTSAYPAPAEDGNLRAMMTLRDRFDVPVGYSDHTLGIAVATASASLGAVIIEKHITLDRSMDGPDQFASLEPDEFAAMASSIREAFVAIGDGTKAPRASEEDTRMVSRRSLVLNRPLSAGETIRETDLDAMRPASGISPLLVDMVVGRRAAVDLEQRVILHPNDLDPPLLDAVDGG